VRAEKRTAQAAARQATEAAEKDRAAAAQLEDKLKAEAIARQKAAWE
jgi:hypothetical protein